MLVNAARCRGALSLLNGAVGAYHSLLARRVASELKCAGQSTCLRHDRQICLLRNVLVLICCAPRQSCFCVACRALAREEAQAAANEASSERRWLAELAFADGGTVYDLDEEELLPGVWRP